MSTRVDQGHFSPQLDRPEQVNPSLTERLAEFLASTGSHDLPPRAIEDGKYFLLDWLASAIAGTRTRPGQMVLAHAAEQGTGPSSVVGLSDRKGTQPAAFANGSLSHITETDDVHRSAVVHPATVVMPAALAVAERLGSSGIDFLSAVVLGYEVDIRVGESVGNSHYYYWHNTSTCGTFGAAAAAGWILGLPEQQMAWALGNAGSLSSGLWQFNEDGAMAKHLHAGHAASSGVLVAELAARGLHRDPRCPGGEAGSLRCHLQGCSPRTGDQRTQPRHGALQDQRVCDQAIPFLPSHPRASRPCAGHQEKDWPFPRIRLTGLRWTHIRRPWTLPTTPIPLTSTQASSPSNTACPRHWRGEGSLSAISAQSRFKIQSFAG